MHQLTALSLKNRALIALVTIVAAVFGLLGVGSLKQELMPSVQFPTIAVVTSYPGASPEVVNNDVSTPIETALRGVPHLESSTATSGTGVSTVLAEFTYGVDIAATEQKVERAISRISQALPASAEPQVVSGSIDDFPVIQIAVTPADGETPESTAQLLDRVAIPELSDLDGVREASLTGAQLDRITITPDAGLLAANGLSPQSVTEALQQSGVLIAAGTVADGDRTLAVQAGSELHSAEEIAAIPLPAVPAQLAAPPQEDDPAAGTPRTIGEVATVVLGPGPQESISRVNGEAALTIGVTKTSEANTVEVSHAVQEALDGLADQLGGAQLTIIFDQAPYIEQSIHTLTTEGLLGLVFAVLVILVFLLSVRATLVTAISIPTSVLLTFIGLNFADYTLNMLTLGALTISIGRVVDDSIVVIENIKRHLADGGDRTASIIEAVREVAGAITASTITTVAVFLPMAFVSGMVGELFRPFAFTVTIALAASLLVALTIVPVLAYWFLRGDRGGRVRQRSNAPAEAERPTALQRGYRPIIEWTLRRPVVTLLIAVVVFGATLAATPLMKTNYLGNDGQNSVGLVQTLEPGTSLDAQLAQAERVEEALQGVDAIETVQVTIGSAGGAGALFGGSGDGSLSYAITTDADADQAAVQDEIRSAVDGLEDAGEFSLGQSGGGVTMSSAIEVEVTAPDQATLAEASDAVLAALRDVDGLQEVESDLGQSRPFLRIAVDRGLAARAGLTEAGVAGQVAQQMQPSQIGQITMDDDTVSVYLATGTAAADQTAVAALPIQTALGVQRLDQLAGIAVEDGPVTVRTEDGVRMVTVSALPAEDDLGTASAAITTALDGLELPGGADAAVGGVISQQGEAFEQLGLALLAAILIVYVVMVATFRSLLQPLLLLISVPFAATGALLLLILTGIPLGVASLIGVLMLIGIVVTNAIVLVDLINQYRRRGDPLRDAVLHGALQRLRPIVMTALATILALTPMGLGITGKGGFISQPLAVVVIGGLLSSTVLTLVVLPTLYYLVERRRERGSGERRTRSPRAPRPPRRRGGDVVEAGTLGFTGSAPAVVGAAGAAAGAGDSAGAGAALGAGIGSARTGAVQSDVVQGDDLLAGAVQSDVAQAGAALTDAVRTAAAQTDTDAEDWIPEDPVSRRRSTFVEEPPHVAEEPPHVVEEPPHVTEDPLHVAEEPGAGPIAAPVADPETQRAILDELLRVGRSAPETTAPAPTVSAEPGVARSEDRARGVDAPNGEADVADRLDAAAPDAADASEPVAPGGADAGTADPVAPATSDADIPLQALRLPEPVPEDAAVMGPATEEMSLALADLGFVGDDNPLSDLFADAGGVERPEARESRIESEAAIERETPLGQDAPADPAAPDAPADPAAPDASADPAAPDASADPDAPAGPAGPASPFAPESLRHSERQDDPETPDASEPATVPEASTGSPEEAEAEADASADAATVQLRLPEAAPRSPEPADPVAAPDPEPAAPPETALRRSVPPETAPSDPVFLAPEQPESAPGPLEPEQPDTDADPTEAASAPQAAPPVTGELNWEQLLWEATQDAEEADGGSSPDSGARSSGDERDGGADRGDADGAGAR
ncbi:efflux RND transporter permease subunit [Leucobacter allii]|uniref:Efflux RND transporter permease subunit n=1 Tax=Leucobacter allii TaxID=2932247 RepID=A0ABY4FJU1_9MICO|nr:efflux RND transporter permease subunit [Leucobacter allii]UOQ56337.1 efflux RND transporter permease subunit [Leucobacter allii]